MLNERFVIENIDFIKENIKYMDYLKIKKEHIIPILGNTILPYGSLFDFRQYLFEEDIYEYDLYTSVYNSTINRNVKVFLTNEDEINAQIIQCYNIPDKKYTDVEFAICVSKKVIELNDVLYQIIVGHELSHIDLYHLSFMGKEQHRLQTRHPMIEVYCDIKGFEMYGDKSKIKENFKLILDSIFSHRDSLVKSKFYQRELELRKKFMQLYIQDKINSKTILDYINKNYKNHINFVSDNIAYEDYLFDVKFPNVRKMSQAARNRLCDYGAAITNKYYI